MKRKVRIAVVVAALVCTAALTHSWWSWLFHAHWKLDDTPHDRALTWG